VEMGGGGGVAGVATEGKGAVVSAVGGSGTGSGVMSAKMQATVKLHYDKLRRLVMGSKSNREVNTLILQVFVGSGFLGGTKSR